MKNLILLRHAKSSWKNPNLNDYNRPLNKRGFRDVPLIAEIFIRTKIQLNLILTSEAKRALQTSELFIDQIKFTGSFLIEKSFYEATAHKILGVINDLQESYTNVLLVAHNPGLTFLANDLSNAEIQNVPTCGLVGLSYAGNWKDLSFGKCDLKFFEFPKKYK